MVSDVDAPAIRRFLEEIGYPVDPGRLVERPDQLPSTLCYLVVDGRLLMLRREKEPFAHHWTAPGGKIQPGETPRQAIEREVREETGLSIVEPKLKAICSETGGPDYNWLLFIFRAETYRGRLEPGGEGELRWLPLFEIDAWKLPSVDRRILPLILDDAPEPYFIRVVYDANHDVARFEPRPLAEYVE